MKRKSQRQFLRKFYILYDCVEKCPKNSKNRPPYGIFYDRIFVCKIGDQTGSRTNVRVLIGLEAKRQTNALIGQIQNSPLLNTYSFPVRHSSYFLYYAVTDRVTSSPLMFSRVCFIASQIHVRIAYLFLTCGTWVET